MEENELDIANSAPLVEISHGGVVFAELYNSSDKLILKTKGNIVLDDITVTTKDSNAVISYNENDFANLEENDEVTLLTKGKKVTENIQIKAVLVDTNLN